MKKESRNNKRNKIKYRYDFSEKEFIINPYTFVEGMDEVERIEKDPEKGSRTGVFTCRIYPKTPILIPDPFAKEKFRESDNEGKKKKIEHYSYNFFSLDFGESKIPVIPGSSIRGPLRSMYEALTDSCYSTAGKDQYITARTKTAFKPGLLIKKENKWELYSATRYKFQIQEYLRASGAARDPRIASLSYKSVSKYYGESVDFQGFTREVEVRGRNIKQYYVGSIVDEGSNKTGYYYIGEYISNKKYESIFVKGEKVNITYNEVKSAFEPLKEILNLYRDVKINQKFVSSNEPWDENKHGGYANIDLESFEKNGGELPIWYKKIGEKYYFSFASIGRFQYYTPIDKILEKKSKMPCSNLKKLCKACSLFGMIGEEEGLGSCVRISDAVYDKKSIENIKKYNLTELRTPHPSYLPFYAITEDYLAGYDDKKCNIRGRKFYRHFTPDYKTLNNLLDEKVDTKMSGILEGSFIFKVYFEKLTDEQLAELAMLLCLGENKKDGKYCFKLGHGKSLGFGSAKIVVEKLEMRSFDPTKPEYKIQTYNEVKRDNKENTRKLFTDVKFEANTLKNMKDSLEKISKVLCFDTVSKLKNGIQVSYPDVLNKSSKADNELEENILASSQWFSENWKFGANSPKKTLPKLQDEDQTLPSVEYSEH